MKSNISVVINTLNEERNLPFALRSVHEWADEIIVVDMHSEDSTVDIAHEFGAKVYFHERMGFADPARAFAISKATSDWVLILDADEIIPPQLSTRLMSLVQEDRYDVIRIHMLNYLLGSPLNHTGWGPGRDKHDRLFRAGFLNATPEIHHYLKPSPDARIYELPYVPNEVIVHFNYINISHFLDKLNRYTSIEAEQAKECGVKPTLFNAVLKAAKDFLKRYLVHQGYRDGWRGLYLSLFMVFYHLVTFAKMTELSAVGTYEDIRSTYNNEAEKWLEGYNIE
jgi:glycosyltransferase involved in cell wall biosynthesis